jgi:hypothetical protein
MVVKGVRDGGLPMAREGFFLLSMFRWHPGFWERKLEDCYVGGSCTCLYFYRVKSYEVGTKLLVVLVQIRW